MVGLVLVSHSRPLAEALYELVRQVSQTDLPIAIAAGVGDGRAEFGTDAIEIAEAIQKVHSPEGVLVLMDLGSAVISAELALELLPDDMRSSVHLCPAPLIEGSIAAAVIAAHESSLETVCGEARGALQPKLAQLGEPVLAPPVVAAQAIEPESLQITVSLANQHGLHARPAAQIVKLLQQFDARIEARNLARDTGPKSAHSLNGLTTLGARHGDEIQFTATGPAAAQALSALQTLVENNFGETDQAEIPQAPVSTQAPSDDPTAVQAIPISEGIAIGPAFHFRPVVPSLPDGTVDDPAEAWQVFEAAGKAALKKIQQRADNARTSLGPEQAAIFEAHTLILEDPELISVVRARVFDDKLHPAVAWHQAISETAGRYRSLEDPYLQQRAADVEDVGLQLLLELTGDSHEGAFELPGPSILIAEDLTPTQTAQIDLQQVLGLITLGGGPTSHSAILARARSIPAVGGAGSALSRVREGTRLGLDGGSGQLWIEPEQEVLSRLEARQRDWQQAQDRLRDQSAGPAVTRDGHTIVVAANIGGLQDAAAAARFGAEAVGLLRTEFLFLTRTTAPDEETQYKALVEIAEAVGDRPIKVRTLDAGGDKELPYLDLPQEANPYLGVRAIRLSLQHRELFLTQLRAILRAGLGRQFSVMFPMISRFDEIQSARRLLAAAHESLLKEHTPHAWPIQAGIMVETPSAALLSGRLAESVDYFSIGTNDLTQYTLAAERGHPFLAEMADALNPAVLQLIKQVTEAARRSGLRTSVCGELAGDPLAAPVLIGLGVDELSLNAAGIPKIKAVIRAIDRTEAAGIAEEALAASDSQGARRIAKAYYDRHTLD